MPDKLSGIDIFTQKRTISSEIYQKTLYKSLKMSYNKYDGVVFAGNAMKIPFNY